jgi:phospholipase/carboxylesterase
VHGRAQSPEYMLEALVTRLELSDVAYVLPRADDGSWYPGRYFDPRPVNEPWLGQALGAVTRALDALARAGIEPERTVLAGFSQGACLVCEHLERLPAPYLGVAVITGCLLGPDEEEHSITAVDGLPIYLGTRRDDAWITAERVRAAAGALAGAGADVTLDVRAPGPHEIDPEDVRAVRALLLA